MIAMNGDRNESDRSEFDKLLDWDRITVKVAPEKKGLILKHIEYEIRSQVSLVVVGITRNSVQPDILVWTENLVKSTKKCI